MSSYTQSQQAFDTYQSHFNNWYSLCQEKEQIQKKLADLLLQVSMPDHLYHLTVARAQIDILMWKINCAARLCVKSHSKVTTACVQEGVAQFMEEQGISLVNALAPYLLGAGGINSAISILATAIVKQASNTPPVINPDYSEIIPVMGLKPNKEVLEECIKGYTKARHHKYRYKEIELARYIAEHKENNECQ